MHRELVASNFSSPKQNPLRGMVDCETPRLISPSTFKQEVTPEAHLRNNDLVGGPPGSKVQLHPPLKQGVREARGNPLLRVYAGARHDLAVPRETVPKVHQPTRSRDCFWRLLQGFGTVQGTRSVQAHRNCLRRTLCSAAGDVAVHEEPEP